MPTILLALGSLLAWLLGALPSELDPPASEAASNPTVSTSADRQPTSPASELGETPPPPPKKIEGMEDGETDEQDPTSPPRPPRLPDVVVTTIADETSRYRTPIDYGAARDVIDPREVDESGAINSQELLRRTPSVFFFEETGTDSKPNIALRGVTSGSEGSSRSANVSLLADGIPLAPAPYGHAGQSLFPFTLERVHAVDMLRGGHTVRYGPNTVSGVINYLTRPIPRQSMLEQSVRINTYGDVSSYTGIGGTYGKMGIWAESVYKTGDTYRDHGDFTIQNHAIKSSYEFTENLRGLFQIEYFDDESDLAGGLSRAAFKADPEQSQTHQDRFEGDQVRGNFRLEYDIDDDSRLDFSGFAFGGDRTFYLGKPRQYGAVADYIDATPRPMSVWAFQPQYTRWYDLGDIEGELVCGIRHQVEDVTRKSTRTWPDGTYLLRSHNLYDYRTWSGFVENTFRSGKFSLTPGVRVEAVDIDGKNKLTGVSVNRDFTEVLPAVSGSYLIDDEWSVYANVQSSFLPPQANHVEISDLPQNLEAQYAWTYEIGTRSTLWDGLVAPDLTLYSIDYRDRIERDPDHDDVFLNTGNTQHQGVELAVDSDLAALSESLDGVSLFTTVSYNKSEYENGDYEGNTVPHAPHLIAAWGASYHPYETGFWAGIDGYFVGRAYSDADNTGRINAEGTRGRRPAYSVWNARMGYEHRLAKNITLRAQVGCINLLDEEYFEVRAGKGLFLGPPQGLYSTLGITVDL